MLLKGKSEHKLSFHSLESSFSSFNVKLYLAAALSCAMKNVATSVFHSESPSFPGRVKQSSAGRAAWELAEVNSLRIHENKKRKQNVWNEEVKSEMLIMLHDKSSFWKEGTFVSKQRRWRQFIEWKNRGQLYRNILIKNSDGQKNSFL